MRVVSLMTTGPFTIQPDATLDEAIELMDRLDVRHLPVVEQGRLVGVISERDLLRATGWLLAEGPPAAARCVAEVMSAHPVTVEPDTEVVSIAVEMITGAFGCLPVTSTGKLVGIVTERDVLRAFLKAVREGRLDAASDPPVARLMTRDPQTVSAGATVREAEDRLRQRHIRHLPIVDGERLVGMLSDRDVRRAHGRHQEHEVVLHTAMRRTLMTVAESVPTSTAIDDMLGNGVSALPVTTAEGRLTGIITTTDMLDHCMNTLWKIE